MPTWHKVNVEPQKKNLPSWQYGYYWNRIPPWFLHVRLNTHFYVSASWHYSDKSSTARQIPLKSERFAKEKNEHTISKEKKDKMEKLSLKAFHLPLIIPLFISIMSPSFPARLSTSICAESRSVCVCSRTNLILITIMEKRCNANNLAEEL